MRMDGDGTPPGETAVSPAAGPLRWKWPSCAMARGGEKTTSSLVTWNTLDGTYSAPRLFFSRHLFDQTLGGEAAAVRPSRRMAARAANRRKAGAVDEEGAGRKPARFGNSDRRAS